MVFFFSICHQAASEKSSLPATNKKEQIPTVLETVVERRQICNRRQQQVASNTFRKSCFCPVLSTPGAPVAPACHTQMVQCQYSQVKHSIHFRESLVLNQENLSCLILFVGKAVIGFGMYGL